MDLDFHGKISKDPPISRLLSSDLSPGKLPPYTSNKMKITGEESGERRRFRSC